MFLSLKHRQFQEICSLSLGKSLRIRFLIVLIIPCTSGICFEMYSSISPMMAWCVFCVNNICYAQLFFQYFMPYPKYSPEVIIDISGLLGVNLI